MKSAAPHAQARTNVVKNLPKTIRESSRFFLGICCWLIAVSAQSSGAENSSDFVFSDITKPEFFPILPWDANHNWLSKPLAEQRSNGLESIAECRFNMAGFVLPEDLPRCAELGLGAWVLPPNNASKDINRLREWKHISDEEIEERVKQTIFAAGTNPAVAGYFIMDEPGLKDFPVLAKAVATVKKYAPGKFAYINLFPDYATIGATNKSQLGTSNYTEYLEHFVAEVNPQALSYDNYRVQQSEDLKRPNLAASYYHNLLEVRRVAQKHELPYLNIVSANQIRPTTPIPSPANLLFQAYTTLAAGYRGVGWYTYFAAGYGYAPIDSSGSKSPTWAYLQQVNAQVLTLAPIMCRLTSTGVYFTSPAPADGLPLLPGEIVTAVICSSPIMVGEFRHTNGDRYVMFVNLSLERSAKISITFKSPFDAIQIMSAVDGSLSTFNQTNDLWLAAGQGVLLKTAVARPGDPIRIGRTFKEGDLIGIRSGTVFLIRNGVCCKISSRKVFEARGFKWENVIKVSDEEVQSIPAGEAVR